MSTLCKRERRKRTYNKTNAEFWNGGKQAGIKKRKEKCVSTKNQNASIENVENFGGGAEITNESMQRRNSKEKEKKRAKKTTKNTTKKRKKS